MKRSLPYLSLLFTLFAAGLSHQLRSRHTPAQVVVERLSKTFIQPARQVVAPAPVPVVRVARQEQIGDSVALFWKPLSGLSLRKSSHRLKPL